MAGGDFAHHVMTSIWIKIPHQNGNEMKGRKTISKKKEQEFRWISGKCVLCCHNANYTQIYIYFTRLLDASTMFYVVPHCRSSHSHRIVRARIAFWLELLIYFDSILSLTKLTRQTTNSPNHMKNRFCHFAMLSCYYIRSVQCTLQPRMSFYYYACKVGRWVSNLITNFIVMYFEYGLF